MTEQQPAPAGWYAHPSMADTQRYWDGQQWTDHIAPGSPQTAPASPRTEAQANHTLITVGLLSAFLLPILGFIVGVILLAKREAAAGVVVVLLAIGSAYLWLYLLVS